MDKSIINKIDAFLLSQSRNKIVFYKDYPFDFTPIDLGFLLSQSIYSFDIDNKLSMKFLVELDNILCKSIINHNNFGKIIAIKNIGFLLEPDLKQDLRTILEKYSNNNSLFVKWNGEIENGNLYFLSKENGIKININELSHIIV